jgi:hypothetical protein
MDHLAVAGGIGEYRRRGCASAGGLNGFRATCSASRTVLLQRRWSRAG